MSPNTSLHMIDLTESRLFELLGEAWYAQCTLYPGQAYVLESSATIGKREFGAILPALRSDLKTPHAHGLIACVAGTIRRNGTWAMPAKLVAGLVVKLGLAETEPATEPLPGGDLSGPVNTDQVFSIRPNLVVDLTSTAASAFGNRYKTPSLTGEFPGYPRLATEAGRDPGAQSEPAEAASGDILLFDPVPAQTRRRRS